MKRLLTIDRERLQTVDYRPQNSLWGGQGLLFRLALLLCLVVGE